LLSSTSTTTKTPNSNDNYLLISRLEKIINKYKSKGLTTVVDYLLAKSRKSQRTAMIFSCGLDYLDEFIQKYYDDKDIQTILPLMRNPHQIDVYKLLNSFVDYLQNETPNGSDLSPSTLRLYLNASKSYFQFHDIDVIPSKYKYRVSLPTLYHVAEAPIDSSDIKEVLNHCTVRRLKPFLLCLASGGMRAIECLSMRLCDVDFSDIDFNNPNDKSNIATVRIRKQFSKTRTEHITFISNEAARYLKQWIDWKYRDRHSENKHLKNRIRTDNDLIFTNVTYKGQYPLGLYTKICFEFQKTLDLAGMSARKEEGAGHRRRKITMHSFRRFCKTTISNQAGADFSEFILGHKGSVYYVNKTEELKAMYRDKCQKYLTFLDYPTLDSAAKSLEDKLKQKDKQIEELTQRDWDNTERINKLESKIEELFNDWEQTVKDETRMVKRGAHAVDRNMKASIEQSRATKEFADNVRKILSQKQLTSEQIKLLGSTFQDIFNTAAKTESELKEIKNKTKA
jgi:integrase